MKYILLGLTLLITFQIQSQTNDLSEEANSKIKILESLIEEAENQKFDVLKEKTTIVTAKTFLKFADWDQDNVEINKKLFKNVPLYRKNALQLAETLARFERKEVIKILDKATEEINDLLLKKINRKPSVLVDWSKAALDGDQITYNGSPVFLSDYFFKPKEPELDKYYGNQDGFLVAPYNLVSEEGLVDQKIMNNLSVKSNGTLGYVYINNAKTPEWSTDKYGEDFKVKSNVFTGYDIDHPGARELQKMMLAEVTPYMAGKKFSELGYMIADEPQFYNYKKGEKIPNFSSAVSKFTLKKFNKWLSTKHKSIETLNKIWGTSFSDFDNIVFSTPIDISLKGAAQWYDWSLFNMDRVTDWYGYIKYRIKKEDPDANVHMKINPKLWTNNKRSHGVDLEALTNLSGIIGNKSGAEHIRVFGKPHKWEQKYVFDWRELCMGFDFMKSVSPNKITYNTEAHYLSSKGSKDLYLDPMYARASFWLAHIYGMTASQIWYWPRNLDGSLNLSKAGKGYSGTNNQQARVTNEVAMTMIDLNSNAEDIMSMQRQRKSIRIFYSKTSAINKKSHMDDVFELYESLNFEGTPIGFVTENIINTQENKNWDVVLVRKTPNATQKEFDALQSYLNNGGTVLIDDNSLLMDEYGMPLSSDLKAGNGKIIRTSSLAEFKNKSLDILEKKGLLSPVYVTEDEGTKPKGCIWRVVKDKEGANILSIVNVGKEEIKVKITFNNSNLVNCQDIITGVEKAPFTVLKPYEVFFVKITKL